MWAAPWGRLEVLGSYTWNKSVPAVIIPFCWILLIGTATLCIRFWSTAKLFVFGLAWFLIVSFPSGNFIPLGNTPYADYYVGIPAIGLCIALAATLAALLRSMKNPSLERAARNACGILFFALIAWRIAGISEQRVWAQAWKNPVVVMAYTANARPHQYLAKSIAASQMVADNDLETARFYAESAIKDAPWLAPAHMAMADVLYSEGKSQEAAQAYLKAIESTHVSPRTTIKPHFMIGQIIGENPANADEAFEHLFVVLKNHDSEFNLPAILYTADLFKRAERPDDQLTILNRGLEYHPGNRSLLTALDNARNSLAPKSTDPGADPS
jgi:tetratricopeptide (TPR) repeat protein